MAKVRSQGAGKPEGRARAEFRLRAEGRTEGSVLGRGYCLRQIKGTG
jgi:hypothetical protein